MYLAGSAVVGLAVAGGGPWVQSTENASVYLGTEAQRIETFVPSDTSPEARVSVDSGLSIFLLKGVVSVGVTPRTEVEVGLPYGVAFANRQDGPLCAALGRDACAETAGLAPLTVRGKFGLAEEVYGDPVSAAVGVGLRYGAWTAPERARLTNLGEGTFDASVFASVGKSGGLGAGYFYSNLDGEFRYRTPIARLDGTAIPGPEVLANADFVAVPDSKIGIGVTGNYFARVGGVDFEQANLADVDRFTSLRLQNVQVGAKLIVGGSGRTTFSASVLRSVYAKNNPLITSVAVGVSFADIFPSKDET